MFRHLSSINQASHIVSQGHMLCPYWDIFGNKGQTSWARKQFLNLMHFPVRDLDGVSCHSLYSLRMFNHLPSWYVEWRTSAISTCCHQLPAVSLLCLSKCKWPPGGLAAGLGWDPLSTSLDEELTPPVLCSSSSPCQPVDVSLPHTHFQICSFKFFF